MKAVGLYLSILLVFFGFQLVSGQTPENKRDQSTNAPTGDEDKTEQYRIGFQDTLEISVIKHPDLGGVVSVNSDGTIYLPRTNKPIKAVCKTVRELAQDVIDEYKSFLRNPFVNVRVADQKSQSYGVIGAVEKPGTYFVNRKIRLLELFAYAGGPNKEAGNRMIVARTGSSSACRETIESNNTNGELILMSFKIKDVLEAKQNLWMQPGDIVSVLDADEVYVYGNVNKVGSVKMKEPITLTQAIVSAEGLKPTAKNQVRILRQIDGSTERKELVFDLKDIEKRKVDDPFLEPNDIVAVSQDPSKTILRGVMKTFQQGLPSLFYRVP